MVHVIYEEAVMSKNFLDRPKTKFVTKYYVMFKDIYLYNLEQKWISLALRYLKVSE